MEKKKSTNPFVSILKRDNKTIKADRAVRIGQSVKEAQIKLILDMRASLRGFEDQKAAMTDISASNSVNSMNAIVELNAAEFVTEYHAISVRIELADRELQIAIEVGMTVFGIDPVNLFD